MARCQMIYFESSFVIESQTKIVALVFSPTSKHGESNRACRFALLSILPDEHDLVVQGHAVKIPAKEVEPT